MSFATFDRDSMARWHADRQMATDPEVEDIYYLKTNAPDREVRLIEVNSQIVPRDEDPIHPLDFGVDRGGETDHKLLIADVTPGQWAEIESGKISLPDGWTLEGAIHYPGHG